MRIGSLFSGYGGLDLGVQTVLGGTVAWHFDIDTGACRILAHHWPDVSNLGDVSRVDWAEVEPIDVLTGGYPCQPFSHAGKRKGTADERHLWPHVREAVRRLRPRLTVLENVAGHRSMGLDRVLGDMAEDGLHARWVSVRASDVGAPHRRERLFIVAYPADADLPRPQGTQPAQRRDMPAGGDREALMPTPRATDHYGPGLHGNGNGHGASLAIETLRLLPTPNTMDGMFPRSDEALAQARLNGGCSNLKDVIPRIASECWGGSATETVALLPTPAVEAQRLLPTRTSSDAKASGGGYNGQTNVTLTDATVRGHGPQWGAYGPAIARWESVVGREAPPPTESGQLSPRFVEWMMGLPAGHVTDPAIGLSRPQQLKALGNGVVPQQAAHALRILLGPTMRAAA